MATTARLLPAAALLLLACLAPGEASAFAWRTSPESGAPLRWHRPEIAFTVSTVEPEEVPLHEAMELLQVAFDTWSDLPGCRVPQVDVVGTTTLTRVTTPRDAGEEPDNHLVFIRSAPKWKTLPGATSAAIALTFVAHRSATGEIVDADIAVNDAAFGFTVDDDAVHGVDLLSMLVHEVGHFYGLDHSDDPEATMHADYGRDAALRLAARTLSPDDVEGICALYADVVYPGEEAPAASGGCAGGPGGSHGPLLVAAALLGLAARRRARPPAR